MSISKTKEQLKQKIQDLTDDLETAKRMLKDFETINRGDFVKVTDCSYACKLTGDGKLESAPQSLYLANVIVVITGYSFPTRVFAHGKENDTLISFEGELYSIQKRLLSKEL